METHSVTMKDDYFGNLVDLCDIDLFGGSLFAFGIASGLAADMPPASFSSGFLAFIENLFFLLLLWLGICNPNMFILFRPEDQHMRKVNSRERSQREQSPSPLSVPPPE